nr:UDP-3-O-acyl-N-acetylglucosamine deacetylase [Planctomycetota bacterium]
MRPRAQRTIKAPIDFVGVGLHSGDQNKVTILPAPADHGIVFCRVDLEGKPTIPAHISKLSAKERRTNLREGEADVATVEHLLAALYALQIDNVTVEIDGEEMPGLDGSALPFAEKLNEVGGVDQKVVRKHFVLD